MGFFSLKEFYNLALRGNIPNEHIEKNGDPQ
jgi:hypothetical protein